MREAHINATISQFHSFFANSVQIFIIFSLTEPPKIEMLYVYTMCAHTQNHDLVEFFFLPIRKV